MSASLELANYFVRINGILSLFVQTGIFVFIVLLGTAGVRSAAEMREKVNRLAAKTQFLRRMNHDMRTPLTKILTNIQIAIIEPEEAGRLLENSQKEIMKMAALIDGALSDREEAKTTDENDTLR